MGLLFFSVLTRRNVIPRNWFKGQDTVTLLAFLEHKLHATMDDLDGESRPLFTETLAAIQAANKFMSTMYHGALWLTDTERLVLLTEGHKCALAMRKCADIAYRLSTPRFKYQPKLHMLGEMLFVLEGDRRCGRASFNPINFSTQMDEDFVGQIAQHSRRVSVRTVHERTLTRYQVALAQKW